MNDQSKIYMECDGNIEEFLPDGMQIASKVEEDGKTTYTVTRKNEENSELSYMRQKIIIIAMGLGELIGGIIFFIRSIMFFADLAKSFSATTVAFAVISLIVSLALTIGAVIAFYMFFVLSKKLRDLKKKREQEWEAECERMMSLEKELELVKNDAGENEPEPSTEQSFSE